MYILSFQGNSCFIVLASDFSGCCQIFAIFTTIIKERKKNVFLIVWIWRCQALLGRFFSNFYVLGYHFRFCFPLSFCSVVAVVLFFCLMSLPSIWFRFVCALLLSAVFLFWCFVYKPLYCASLWFYNFSFVAHLRNRLSAPILNRCGSSQT